MQFDYEIPVDEYTDAQMLYYRANNKSRVIKRGLRWVLLGLFFLLIGWFRWAEWGPVLLLLTGVWFIYSGTVTLFPAPYYRRSYPRSGLPGKNYRAEVNEEGFSVTGDSHSWRVLWQDAALKGEGKRVFMFSTAVTIFIFGKKYLTEEQQNDMRRLAALPSRDKQHKE